jgi:beta-lactamase regulating signal transducer with metallopeptidase domain
MNATPLLSMNGALITGAVINAAMMSAPLTALIWIGMRFIPARTLSAAARYVVWWVALALTIALPAAFLPTRPFAAPVRIASSAPVEEAAAFEPSPPATPMPSATPRPRRFPLRIPAGPWMLWIAAAWALSATLFLLRLAISCAMLTRRKARARGIPVAFPISTPASTGRKIRVAVSGEVSAPMAAGFLRPAILIPERLIHELDGSELDFIGLHEAAHFARYDDYALIVERLIEALFALHPVVRWIARQIDLEREVACDDRVVEATGQPHPYARCLTRVAELTGGVRAPFSAAAAATRGGSHLTRRVEMLLDKTRRTGARWLKTRVACAVAVVAALAWMAGRAPALLAFTTPSVTTPPPSRVVPAVTVTEIPAPRLIAQIAVPQAPAPERSPDSGTPLPLVLVDVTVRDNGGRLVQGLLKENFRVREDGVEQQISYFATEDLSTSLGVVSLSPDGLTLPMQEEVMQLQQAIPVRVEFIEAADPNSSFDDNATAAVNQIQQASNRRKVILMVEGQTPFGFPGIFSFAQAGVTVIAAPPGMNDAVKSVAPLIPDSYYVLGYTPSNRPADGAYRSVRVGLSAPRGLPPLLATEHRSGYYANGTAPACRPLPSLPPNSTCY